MSGELMAWMRTAAQVGAEEAAGGLLEAQHLPKLHVEGFDDAVAGDGFVQDVLDLGELVLAAARGVRTSRPILRAEATTTGTKSSRTQAELAAEPMTTTIR